MAAGMSGKKKERRLSYATGNEVRGRIEEVSPGRKVLVMYDETLEADKPAFTVEPLEEMLKRNRFLVEVPAVENPDFKETVHQMAASEKLPPKSLFGKNQRQRL